jgi:hypothetical protein
VNLQLSGDYNAVAPDNGPEWLLRFRIQPMLPKSVQ